MFRVSPPPLFTSLCLAPLSIMGLPAHTSAQSTLTVSSSSPSNIDLAVTQVFFTLTAKLQDVAVCGLSVTRVNPEVNGIATLSPTAVTAYAGPEGASSSDSGQWSFLQTDLLEAQPDGQLAYVEFESSVTIPAGQTRSFAVSGQSLGSEDFFPQGLAAVDPIFPETVENDDLALHSGQASLGQGLFKGTSTDAQFIGVVHYSTGSTPCGNGDLPVIVLPSTLYDGPEPGGVGPLQAGNVYVISPGASGWSEVPAGKTLTAEPNTIIKLGDGSVVANRINVKGTIDWEDTTVTSIFDDALGGDSDAFLSIGSAEPAPGDWQGINFDFNSDASDWNGGGALYGGSNPTLGTIHLNDSDAQVIGLWLRLNDVGSGFTIDANDKGAPVVERNFISDNEGLPLGGFSFDMLGNLRDNVAIDNTVGDYATITGSSNGCQFGGPAAISGINEINPWNYPGDVLVVDGNVCVQNGAELTLGPGVTVKFTPGIQGRLQAKPGGRMELKGTAASPVTLAGLGNDLVVGDTDKDGQLTALPGDWAGVRYDPGSLGSLTHVDVRDAGDLSGAVELRSSEVSAEALWISDSGGDGLVADAMKGDLSNLVVNRSAKDGIVLAPIDVGDGTTIDIRHATVTNSGSEGIRTTTGEFQGSIDNSIFWNNADSNYGSGINGASVANSLGGFAGLNGNLDQDPMLDADGVPQPGSPVIDAGEADPQLLADIRDGYRNSFAQLADRPEMGAVEIQGTFLNSNKFVAGANLVLTAGATAGVALPVVYLGGEPSLVVLPGIGLVSVGLADAIIFGVGLTGEDFAFPIPAPTSSGPSIVGVAFAVQGFVVNPSGALQSTPYVESMVQSQAYTGY